MIEYKSRPSSNLPLGKESKLSQLRALLADPHPDASVLFKKTTLRNMNSASWQVPELRSKFIFRRYGNDVRAWKRDP